MARTQRRIGTKITKGTTRPRKTLTPSPAPTPSRVSNVTSFDKLRGMEDTSSYVYPTKSTPTPTLAPTPVTQPTPTVKPVSGRVRPPPTDPGLVTLPPGTTFADLIQMDPPTRDAVLAGTVIPRQPRDISQTPVAAPVVPTPTPAPTPKTTTPTVTPPPTVEVPPPVVGPFPAPDTTTPSLAVLEDSSQKIGEFLSQSTDPFFRETDWSNPTNVAQVQWATGLLGDIQTSLSSGDFEAAFDALNRLDFDNLPEDAGPGVQQYLTAVREVARSTLGGFGGVEPRRGFGAIDAVTQPGGPDATPVVDFEGLENRAESFYNQQLSDLGEQFKAGSIDQATAQKLFDDISGRREALSADIQTSIDNNLSPDSVWNRLLGDMEELREGITGTLDPETGEVLAPGIRSRTEEVVNDALDRLNQVISGSQSFLLGLQTQALSDLSSGRTAALTAAVDGIQGNIRSQQSEIDAALDLTDAQKLSMKGQIRMVGALALAPAVGAVLQQYDALQAQVQQSFGSILGGFEGQALTETGALGRMGVSEIAASDKTAAELNANILNLETGVGIARQTARTTLMGLRSQVEAAGDTNLLSLLPELGQPYIQYSPVMLNDYNMFKEIVGLEAAGIYERLGFDNVEKMMASMDEQNQSQFALTMWGIIGPILFGGFPFKA